MSRRREEYELQARRDSGQSGIYPNIRQEVNDMHERESIMWTHIFRRLDTDGDGRIALQELRSYVESSPEEFQNLGQDVIEEIFELADRDMNGYLDQGEFMLMVKDHVLRRKHPELHRLLDFASKIVIPANQRKQKIAEKIEEFKCRQPPVLFILLSLIELGVFVYYAVECSNNNAPLTAEGPVPINSPLIYNPFRRYEAWRYVSYMLIHVGYVHIVSNILVQLLLGIPLEIFHGPFRLFIVYMSGVIAGSLGTSITDPKVYLAGASGGVYAVLTAHISSLVLNWKELEFSCIRLFGFVLFFVVDLGVAIFTRHFSPSGTKIGYAAHLAGGIAGLLIGINVLRNVELERWERILWWVSFFLYVALMACAIAWNFMYTTHFPTPDLTPIKLGSCK